MNNQAYNTYSATSSSQNPFAAEEGNPFDAIPDVADYSRKREFVGTPDYSDGGVYEDDFGPEDPYSSYSTPAPTQTPQITKMPEEEKFPGEEGVFSNVDVEAPTPAAEPDKQVEEEEEGNYHVWNIAYYRGYFNVDTKEVGNRILRSFTPYSMAFFEKIKENPDLYGPFWIATTLIFVMAASANFASYIDNPDDFHYDFRTVTFGSATVYGYITIIPLVLWLVFRWLAVSIGLVQIVCIYGYSLFVFLPIAVLCIIPFEWLRWLLIGLATADSILFLGMNFFPPLIKNNLAESKKVLGGVVVIAIVALLHFGLGLTFKLYFFDYSE